MTGGISVARGRRGGRELGARMAPGFGGVNLVGAIGIAAMLTSGCTPAPPPTEELVTETAALRGAARGLLRDVSGAPIAGARVAVRAAGEASGVGAGATLACDTTSSSGSFSLRVRAGTYDLVVTPRSGFAPQSFPAQTLGGAGMLALILVPISATTEVSGRVLDRHGTPLAQQQMCGGVGGGCTETAPDGTFHLIVDVGQPPRLSISGFTTSGTLMTFNLSLPPATFAGSSGQMPDIVLPFVDLTGQVVGADGAPVAGASMYSPPCYAVSVEGFEGQACLNGIQADATGHFRAVALPGEVSLVVYGPGGTFLKLAVAGDTDVTINLPALQRLTGQVVDRDGNGQEGLSACLTHAGCFSKSCSPTCTRTDAEGRYQLEVAGGDYVLALSMVGSGQLGQFQLSTPLSLSQPAQLNVRLPTVKLTVQVLDSPGLPAAGVQVIGGCYEATINSLTGNSLTGNSLTGNVCAGSAITDADGRLQFEMAAPGTQTLQILGAPPASPTVVVSEDTDIVLSLSSSASGQVPASGQLIDGDGHPLPGAEVCYADPGGHLTCAATDADGRYSLVLVPGTYAISASSFGDTTYQFFDFPSASVPSPALILRSASIGQLPGQLVDGNGRPIAGATIYEQCGALTRDGQRQSLCALAGQVTDDAGRFRIDYLPGASMGLEIDLSVAGIPRRIAMDDVTAAGTATSLVLAIQPPPASPE